MTYRILIDRSVCNGYGACVDADPADFEIGDDGVATASADLRDLEAARDAARQCPMGAITMLDQNGSEVR
jgi:ferredoxin